jgi:putative acetyltransferase
LLDRLRASDAWLPALSFVALADDGEIVAHVGATRGRIGDEPALVCCHPASTQTNAGAEWGRR